MTGKTMGTTYHVKVVAGKFLDVAAVQRKIDARLEQINQSMSTFRPDSELSRFNALSEPRTAFNVSSDFMRVMVVAREIFTLSQGAWDGTVNPLVNLWGFGKDGMLTRIPSAQEIEEKRSQMGFDDIVISAPDALSKKRGDVTLDLASIAKGYGVDQVAALLGELEFTNYLVEIGGEIYAAGVRSDGKAWRIGINQPSSNAASDAVYAVAALRDKAMATSGDYRNFYHLAGRTISHIIDPKTGYPVQNGVVSASVIADSCTLADGLATALMVMGPEKGLDLLNSLPDVHGLIIVRHKDGRLENFPSADLSKLMERP